MKKVLSVLVLFLIVSITADAQRKAPVLKWKFLVPGAVIASPVIDGEVVYFSSLDKNLYAVNLQTGKQLWKFATMGENRSAPLIAGQQLYFLSGDGNVYCLDKNTAKVNWTFKTGGERKYELFAFADHIHSSPVLDGDVLYFGSGDNNIYALNAKTGQALWSFKTGDVVHATPVIKNNNLLVGSFDGYFYNLDKHSGKLIWKFKSVGQRYFPKGEFSGQPAMRGNTVYVGSRDFNLYAINIKTGACNWNHYFTHGWSVAKPQFYKNLVINTTMDERVVAAIDTGNGAIAWRTPLQFDMFGACLVSDSTGYAGTLNGNLLAIDLNSGNILWNYQTDARQKFFDQYFTKDEQFNDTSFALLGKDLGAQVQIFHKVGGIFSQPAKKDNLLVFSSSEGVVYCLAAE
ncbi:PQQ-binding-like beta-propeller repeat protein [Mucilaginibacter sp. L3T2-6]|uniref:outer membrane protein assembly factor BamB family protein n=1 Tax=Mucilaginibacter sp. L3T2-6 TaxID=3062491 RepID=UPI002675DCA0|nr:PQQ-binding-like beta-propeller repeat protein [Mucilaginibacter sp. L3T2-6]MDO3642150.1 PQQ-binding-like beta-propeller repeat protein [Mucilaginibacter sp. L3T2-6]MDV6214645.1 PQQ-binding-like beta-propeller repeat protein [Mucilaginibacter sp. L3T2-6]